MQDANLAICWKLWCIQPYFGIIELFIYFKISGFCAKVKIGLVQTTSREEKIYGSRI